MNRPYFVHIREVQTFTPMVKLHGKAFPEPITDVSTKGGVTVAINGNEDHGYAYAVAYCHSKDNYNKRVGRDKSSGRLLSGRHRIAMPDDVKTIRQAEEYVRRLFI